MIKRLIAAYKLSKAINEYTELADRADFWNESDTAWLATALKSRSGKKLVLVLNNMFYKAAANACRPETLNGDYGRGIARGVHLSVEALKKLANQFSPATAQVATPEDSDDEALPERLRTPIRA